MIDGVDLPAGDYKTMRIAILDEDVNLSYVEAVKISLGGEQTQSRDFPLINGECANATP